MSDFDPAHVPDDRVFFDAVMLACGTLPERGAPDADYINQFAAIAKEHYKNTFGLLRKFEWSDFLSVKWTHYERWYHYHVSEKSVVWPSPEFDRLRTKQNPVLTPTLSPS